MSNDNGETEMTSTNDTTAGRLLAAANDDALGALETAQAEILREGGQECQDWAGEATWFRFTDGSVMWVSGSCADERDDAEFQSALCQDWDDGTHIDYEPEPEVAVYTWRLGCDEIDPHETIDGDGDTRDAAYERFCSLAEAWLDEHEGDAINISVRPLRHGGDIAGLYYDYGLRGECLAGDGDEHDAARELTDRAYAAAWETLSREMQDAEGVGAK